MDSITWRNEKFSKRSIDSFQIKRIVPQINLTGEELIDFIGSHTPNTSFEAKRLSYRFATQSVFRCAFSMDAGCFDRNQDSMYLETFSKTFTPCLLLAMKWIIFLFFPRWLNANIPLE